MIFLLKKRSRTASEKKPSSPQAIPLDYHQSRENTHHFSPIKVQFHLLNFNNGCYMDSKTPIITITKKNQNNQTMGISDRLLTLGIGLAANAGYRIPIFPGLHRLARG